MPDGRAAQSRVIGCRITGFRSRARARWGQEITAFRYAGEPGPDTARRYSPGVVVDVRKAVIAGGPDQKKISTSFVERSNLTIRMQCRRLTRLTPIVPGFDFRSQPF
jgi:hypothetical protein